MIVLVCGSRRWYDFNTIKLRLELLPEDTIIVHGGADGADSLAEKAAGQLGLHTAIVRPRWERYERRAGHIRNAAMLRLKPDRVIAFSLGTGGTQGTIDAARKLGIDVEVHGFEA